MKHLIYLLTVFSLFAQQRLETVVPEQLRIIKSGEQRRWSNDNILILEGDLIIEKGAKLIIDPGTIIKFRPNTDKGATGKDKTKCEIIVRGELIAIGQPFQGKRITFTSAAPAGQERSGDWYGIVIYKNNRDSRIENCEINYAYRGISCYGSSPQIQKSQVLYSYNTGIYLSAKSKALISSNVIQSNLYAGVEVVMRSEPKLSLNTISGNDYGIMIYDSSNPRLGSVSNLKSDPGQNSISDNFSYDLYNHSVANVVAENNSWGSQLASEARNTIYDKKNHPAYGTVDIEPMSNATSTEFQQQIIDSQQSLAVVSNTSRSTRRTQTVTRPKQTTTRTTVAKTTPAKTSTQKKPAEDLVAKVEKKPDPIQKSTTTPKEDEKTSVTPKTEPTTTSLAKAEETTETSNVEPETTTPVADTTPDPEPEETTPETNYTELSKERPFLENFLDPGTGLLQSRAQPVYSGIAAAQNIHGRVIIRAVIGLDGNVETAQVLRSDHFTLDELAIDAAKKHKFTRPTHKGQPVMFAKTLIFKF